METVLLDLGAINGQVPVKIIRKNIVNVHLKVNRDLGVNLSVPYSVPSEWVHNFLVEHIEWIDAQITKYKRASGTNNLSSIRSGSSTQLFGKDYRIIKIPSLENRIDVEDNKICIYLTNVEDEALAQRLFNGWWRSIAAQTYQAEVDSLFSSIFRKYQLTPPRVLIRKMKTLWGSCTPSKNKITLNEYLLKADIRCIRYVVLHELTHLLYPNHNKDFYAFLTVQMPDWKERKKELDMEVVQGL